MVEINLARPRPGAPGEVADTTEPERNRRRFPDRTAERSAPSAESADREKEQE